MSKYKILTILNLILTLRSEVHLRIRTSNDHILLVPQFKRTFLNRRFCLHRPCIASSSVFHIKIKKKKKRKKERVESNGSGYATDDVH